MPRRPPHRPSLATVADKVGVSTATVSNCFNRPEKVSPAVLARVLAEADRQGYAGPDPAARQLSRGRTDTLGLLFTDELAFAFRDPAAVAFIEGLATSCQGAGLNMLLISTESTGDRTTAVGNAVVDGFVVYSVPASDPHLRRILDRQLPTVVVDSPPDLSGVDWVGPDDRAGARALGEVLISLGHRRIGVITGTGRGNYSGPADVGPGQADRGRARLGPSQPGARPAGCAGHHRDQRSADRRTPRQHRRGRRRCLACPAGPPTRPHRRLRPDGRSGVGRAVGSRASAGCPSRRT